MSELPDPISEVLEDTADEARVNRLWEGIEARQARPRRHPAVVPAVAVVTLAAAAALWFFVGRSSSTRTESPAPIAEQTEPAPSIPPAADPVPRPPVEADPLRMADGSALRAVDAESDETIALSDGSRIELAAGASLAPVLNDGDVVRWEQPEGRVRYLVEPGGPRQWRVDAGLAEVWVVGTVFTVDRASDGGVTVEVERGIVRVMSDRLEEPARLMRGDSVAVRPELAVTEPEPAEPPARPTPPPMALDAEALMAQADDARRTGRFDDAVALLERAMARTDDPAAGVAAFTLGRLELDALSHPARAVTAFNRALALPLPPSIRESAEARLVEAYARAGQTAEAQAAAARYLEAHPEGRFVNDVGAHAAP